MAPKRLFALLACVAITLGLGGFVGTAAAAVAPPNDVIGGAIVVSGLPFVQTVDTTGATTDTNDAQVNKTCGAPATGSSVWYAFTAGPSDTLISVDTAGSTYSTGVLIATGTAGALTTKACGPVTAQAPTVSGKTYYILVFADVGPGGTLHISIHGPAPAPANDKADHAVAVSALPFRATLDTSSATTDAVDTQANASCGAPETANSVWYTFKPAGNHHNIFVDASASNYDAGVLIARGRPGALTTVSCGGLSASANLTQGTTYFIMIFDVFGSGGGTLKLHIDDAPNVALNVYKRAHIDPHGVVYLTGTYRCSHASHLHVFGNLIEIVGDKVPVGKFDTLGVPAPICNGKLHPWTGLVLAPNTSPFVPGNAAAFTHALACGDVACTGASNTTVVDLKRGPAAASNSAPATGSSTQTVRRSSVRRYGNALHAATGTWGHT